MPQCRENYAELFHFFQENDIKGAILRLYSFKIEAIGLYERVHNEMSVISTDHPHHARYRDLMDDLAEIIASPLP